MRRLHDLSLGASHLLYERATEAQQGGAAAEHPSASR
jgi:hypothetical protein